MNVTYELPENVEPEAVAVAEEKGVLDDNVPENVWQFEYETSCEARALPATMVTRAFG